ncbi:MAG TPA: endonuclease/exonuclease/phosphatase family protein [Tepidiformaceae bacterium]|nr:endonuclease/exonuclease/phosphatase family protein [Tepidiformaceae bacterium]
MGPLRVVSWNVNARRDSAAQAGAVAAFHPDVVALQEVTPTGIGRFRDAFAALGLPYLLAGAHLAAEAGQEAIAARAVVVASRWPLAPCQPAVVPRQELVVCATLAAPHGPLELVAVHIPTWSNGWETKVETQEGVALRISECAEPAILLGDFNAPKDELPDGTVVPFTRASNVRGRAAELGLTAPGLATSGFVDAFRTANGYGPRDASWFWKNRGRTGGFRLDHIFASPGLIPTACWYAHNLRLGGMSDHSPIIADLEP